MLQVLPQLPPDGQCPGLQLHPTQLERIFISDAKPQLPTVTAEDVSISIMLESIAAFIKDAVQVSHQEVQLALQRTSCLKLAKVEGGTPGDRGEGAPLVVVAPSLGQISLQRSFRKRLRSSSILNSY